MENSPISAPSVQAPRPSVVQVMFAEKPMKLAYYNDQFDLQPGDFVFVEGKMEGLRGYVLDVSYNFKIKLSDYKRVISKADLHVKGQFHPLDTYMVTFSPDVLAYEKAITWFMAPQGTDEVYVSGYDDTSFPLLAPSAYPFSAEVAERGLDYYRQDKVVYLSVNGTQGQAIVVGTRPYEVSFTIVEDQISKLTCSCFCSFNCKHEFAVLLQLRDILTALREKHPDSCHGYWAALSKHTLFTFLIAPKQHGSLFLI